MAPVMLRTVPIARKASAASATRSTFVAIRIVVLCAARAASKAAAMRPCSITVRSWSRVLRSAAPLRMACIASMEMSPPIIANVVRFARPVYSVQGVAIAAMSAAGFTGSWRSESSEALKAVTRLSAFATAAASLAPTAS